MSVNPPVGSLKSLAVTMAAVALVASGCTAAEKKSAPAPEPAPPPYAQSDTVKVEVLPQLSATGRKAEAADDASWMINVKVKGAEAGSDVQLMARDGDDFESVGEGKLDKKRQATLLTTTSGELHVMVGTDDDAIGAELSTDDAPVATFTDDFDEPSVDVADGQWTTREQGFTGVRQCSKALPEAAEVTEGVLRLSVLADPTLGDCQLGSKTFPRRLNGHVGTEGSYEFTYGFAAARIRTQSARGQHSAFWLQTPGGQRGAGPKQGGAEIDVMEYFGDDHPMGGLTSFAYWLDKSGQPQTQGGWVPNLDKFGNKWSKKFHVFSVEWTPKEYIFRIDGQITSRLKGQTSGQPQFVILSLLSSDYELDKFNGKLPEHMDVDWARVWETPKG